MTAAELTALARELFSQLPHPTKPDEPWWTPGQVCKACPDFSDRKHAELLDKFGAYHEIPSPDPMDWAVFGQLLIWSLEKYEVTFVGRDCYYRLRRTDNWRRGNADDPREALLLAVARMKGVAE